MSKESNTVLITGATGLIGSHLTAKLVVRGDNLKLLCRPGSDKTRLKKIIFNYANAELDSFSNLEIVEGDVCDYYSLLEVLEGVTRVYHCAGLVDFDDRNYKQLHKVNAEGTANVVNACLEKGVSILNHVSSVAVFSDAKNDSITEAVFWKASSSNSAYAISKYNAEREVWRGKEEGLQITIVNPALVLGPGCFGGGSGELIEQAAKGYPIYTTGSTGIVDVRDVVNAILILEDQKQFGKRFLLCSENVSFKTLFSCLNQQFSKTSPKIALGIKTLKLLSFFEKLFILPFRKNRKLSSATISSATTKKHYSSEKFLSLGDYRFISFDDSIRDTCNFYKENILKS